MHITKHLRSDAYSGHEFGLYMNFLRPVYYYTVFYKGFVAKDLDLGLAIARCYGAAANDN